MAVRPLRATYSPTHPYVIERHDYESGGIGYEIWDKRPDTYRRLCALKEEPGRNRGQAKKDAEMIVCALNAALPAHETKENGQ